MLVVDTTLRRHGIGSKLASVAIQKMAETCDEVCGSVCSRELGKTGKSSLQSIIQSAQLMSAIPSINRFVSADCARN